MNTNINVNNYTVGQFSFALYFLGIDGELA